MKLCLVVLAFFPLALCAVHKLELGDLANVHKLQYHASTPGQREMSKEEIHKEIHALRQRRSSGDPEYHRYPFEDTHTSGVIQYSGTDQQVIFVLTYTPNSNGIPVTGTNLYKSIDYGETFSNINKRLEASGTLRLWSNFFVSPEDYNQIVFPHAVDSMMYVTKDEGGSFSTLNLQNGINPRTLNFNPTKGEWFLGLGSNANLWVSQDLGSSFIKVAINVIDYDWSVPEIDSSSTRVYFWNNSGDTSGNSYLYSSDSPYTSAKIFDLKLGNIEGYAMVGSYIFTQKKNSDDVISLWVSHARKSFLQALIPSTIAHQNYYVTSIQDYQALVIVEHVDGIYNLYMSGEDGDLFSESLPDLYNTASNGIVTFDLELLESMNGTFIANQFLRLGSSGGQIPRRTLISFDNGGNWNIIQPPATYNNGSLVNCEPPACSLHFHMASSEYWRTGVYSQLSAPGIVIAHGSIGSQLSNDPDLYLSRDGGITWSQALLSSWGVSVLDHGGLIVAAADYHQSPSSVVWYTCTEGLSWKSYNFGHQLIVYGVITEPGETTTVVTLYGWESSASGWVSVQINFTNIFDRKCVESDYYNWEPYDENLDVDCLNGAMVVIERRKPDSCCLNGQEYFRELSVTTCACTAEDYQCDYGYKHSDGFTGPCIRDELVTLPQTCVGNDTYYTQSTGYRKIPGDICTDGVDSEYAPFKVSCCPDPSSTMTKTVTSVSTVTSYTSTLVTSYQGTKTITLVSTITSVSVTAIPTTVYTTVTSVSTSTTVSVTAILTTVPTTVTTTTTLSDVCNASPAASSSSAAATDTTNSRTIFLAVVVVVLLMTVVTFIVVTIVLGIKLYKKRAAGYSRISTRYHAEMTSGSPERETGPGVAINRLADDSDEGEKDDEDLLVL